MQMKEVCEKFDLTPDTLRYYEKVGLIGEVPRDINGYRVFSERNLNEIYFSKVMRKAGIPVQRLAEYINLVQVGEETVEERKNILLEEREMIRKNVEELQATLDILDGKISNYDERILSFEREKLRNHSSKND
jgi:DNA-binding transcriptional MerR regulator